MAHLSQLCHHQIGSADDWVVLGFKLRLSAGFSPVVSMCAPLKFGHGVYFPGVDSGSVGGSPQPGSRAAAPAGTQPRAATGCCPAHAKKSARTV